ncbi:hypothetical protein H0H93_002453, partial [Arthromyces matolae]
RAKGKAKEANPAPPVPPPTIPTPPVQNTREGVKRKPAMKKKPEDKMEVEKSGKAKPSYHFTSTVQERVDMDRFTDKLLNSTVVTMTLGELLGSSQDLSKRFANITRTRREYTEKPVTVNFVSQDNDSGHFSGCTCEEDHDDDDDDDGQETITVEYDQTDISSTQVQERYASAVKIVPPQAKLLAMATGKFT